VKALRQIAVPALVAALALLVWVDPALASKHHDIPSWKIWWDWGWKIVNFLVLAFLIFKVAKKPIKEFLAGSKAKVAAELEEVNQAKAKAEAELKQVQEKTAGMAQELANFEEALAHTAERDRKRMIAEAREASELIMERAQLQAELALQHARRDLSHEIVELATKLAESKLKEAVSKQDQDRLLEKFASGALSARGGAV
jgi:F-type H+-transporting ATPase subunit b